VQQPTTFEDQPQGEPEPGERDAGDERADEVTDAAVAAQGQPVRSAGVSTFTHTPKPPVEDFGLLMYAQSHTHDGLSVYRSKAQRGTECGVSLSVRATGSSAEITMYWNADQLRAAAQALLDAAADLDALRCEECTPLPTLEAA